MSYVGLHEYEYLEGDHQTANCRDCHHYEVDKVASFVAPLVVHVRVRVRALDCVLVHAHVPYVEHAHSRASYGAHVHAHAGVAYVGLVHVHVPVAQPE